MRYLLFLAITLFIILLQTAKAEDAPDTRKPFQCPTINVLYTWVDGSDPVWQESRSQRLGLQTKSDAASANRFRDMNGLLYSLRSIEKFAPFVNKIFIYTANQIPAYLNTSHPKLKMIFHEDVFPNQSDLPTFNSNAIEASFPYLPDEVGPCYIYFNDDMLFSNNVEPKDFWSHRKGQYLFEDGWTAPASQETQDWEPWHRSIAVSNKMLDKHYGESKRPYTDHGPRLFHHQSAKEMGKMFREELALTMTRPLRQPDDTAFPFLYHHYTHYNYKSQSGGAISIWFGLFNDPERVCADLEHLLDNGHRAICMNDQMSEPDESVIECATNFLEKLVPTPSSYELKF